MVVRKCHKIGTVGSNLYYPNNSVQLAGVILGIGDFAGHSHRHVKMNSSGYFNRLNCIQDVSAVTGGPAAGKKELLRKGWRAR